MLQSESRTMTLREFAREYLNLPSVSTNPSHKRFLAWDGLRNNSEFLNIEQDHMCRSYILNDFDESHLDDSELDGFPNVIP